ncbi:VacJ family lipoprotein [Roseomonas sp. M0104]|uniref:VacJ family lipoprotein n=1 Tax=Teichococcus coralli TaxID=2545983 RepID=A0A845B917_9PROT|nr:VacJ family lipoprotein [Pseudoroseomonas coralli]MXP62594.1 VacJ family lipoprotein [Pseudoroseomonas coralli]
MSFLRRPTLLLLGLLTLSACATRPPASEPEALAEYEQANDPLEPFNRTMYTVHNGIDTVLLRPAAEFYRFFLPPPVRTGVRNVLANLRSPMVLVNDALQGETRRGATTLARFLMNSTFGIGGLFDVAEQVGLPGHTEDFGQTLAVWGLGEGPFLFIPALGPSNPRDLAGFGVDIAADPVGWGISDGGGTAEALGWTRLGLTVVDTREGLIEALDTVNETSLDPYATLRSAYRQRRRSDIRNGRPAGEAPAATLGTGLDVTEPPAGQAR